MNKAVILASGGLNSTVAAAAAREQYEPALLHVAWGHRTAERELACFNQIAKSLNIEQTRIADLTCLATLGNNARVNRKIGVEDSHALGQETPATFALGLMPTLLSVAAAWAGGIGATRIIVGIRESHGLARPGVGTLYPDYRREFIQTFNLMLQYARPSNRELAVEAPLLELTRAEVVKLGNLMNVPFEQTWSCYTSNDEPCGRCLACTTRAAGFLKAVIPDPLLLETASK